VFEALLVPGPSLRLAAALVSIFCCMCTVLHAWSHPMSQSSSISLSNCCTPSEDVIEYDPRRCNRVCAPEPLNTDPVTDTQK
jgi:hypothetical protein